MLKNIITELKKYDETRKSLEIDYQKALAKIKKEYAVNGDTYNSFMQEVKNAHEMNIKALTNEVNDTIESVFADTIKDITDYTIEPMNERTSHIIDSVKSMGSGLTPLECDIYADSIKGNYIATKLFAPVYSDIKGAEMHYVSLEDVMKEINEVHSEVKNVMAYYNVNTSYGFMAMVSDNSPIVDADNLIGAFLNKSA